MAYTTVEIKARSNNHDKIREILKSMNADFRGVDHQIDTYFKVNSGRLKLREGNIENYLIYYEREEKKGPRKSNVIRLETNPNSLLKDILTKALGVLVVVEKQREIYFIENVKFHLDAVKGLGTFVEIEARDVEGVIGEEKLLKQCRFFLDLFGIAEKELISASYSDLLLEK